jgi:predicted dehydrogenase
VGTQSRSTDISQQAVRYLQSGQLGKIRYAQAIVYRRRESIGRVDGPQKPPASVEYDLWLGPTADAEIRRSEFHYDWHWQWPTGNGEIGNNGVHYLDRCRWLLGQNQLPRQAISIGGRFVFNDDGQTPNTQIALLDYDPAPIICEVRGLAEKPGSKTMDKFRSLPVGIIVQCEGGCYLSSRGMSAVYDNAGQQITEFADRRDPADQPAAHQENFLSAIRSRDAGQLNADILDGHRSAALCHMANVSYRLGQPSKPDAMRAASRGNAVFHDALERLQIHLDTHGIDLSKTRAVLGPTVTMDSASERFVGENAEQANALSRSRYREPFVVPEIV